MRPWNCFENGFQTSVRDLYFVFIKVALFLSFHFLVTCRKENKRRIQKKKKRKEKKWERVKEQTTSALSNKWLEEEKESWDWRELRLS